MFYRIGLGCPLTIDDLHAPEFFALAHRVPAYGGVMAARMAAQQQGPTAPTQGERREVPSDHAALAAELGDLIEVAHA
ncbi:hypothetical protein [Microbispora sp. KK1-11]|uniref:hypothetical protein n=1 Tax=Microbispora sp. KK1-11 TaxID=2053005 RepID=UPI0011590C08|nr:hypothetical protein [Microbispora sp. KK1-11]TQS30056.1 hypothetical protein FLW16_06760 [Microbispora sp. KK1-11]